MIICDHHMLLSCMMILNMCLCCARVRVWMSGLFVFMLVFSLTSVEFISLFELSVCCVRARPFVASPDFCVGRGSEICIPVTYLCLRLDDDGVCRMAGISGFP